MALLSRSMLIRFALILALMTVLVPRAFAQESSTDNEPRKDAYTVLVERAVNRLVDEDADGFKALLSRNLIAVTNRELGRGKIDFIIRERYIPFFSDFERLDTSANTTTTRDAHGSQGMAFFSSFTNTRGIQKPFVVYVLDEDGKLVVGNLLINKSMSDVVVPDPAQAR